jgi:hypothetical protein
MEVSNMGLHELSQQEWNGVLGGCTVLCELQLRKMNEAWRNHDRAAWLEAALRLEEQAKYAHTQMLIAGNGSINDALDRAAKLTPQSWMMDSRERKSSAMDTPEFKAIDALQHGDAREALNILMQDTYGYPLPDDYAIPTDSRND